MSRWTGQDHVDAVLAAADAWRERCFLNDGSLFGDEALWTTGNIRELKRRFVENPIEGADRTFYEKLNEQLDGAPPEVIRLAAEVVWFVLLFPVFSATRPETKRVQITEVWEWSGSTLPDSAHLSDEALMGVGHPGTAYLTRRYEQFGFLLEVTDAWKALPEAQRSELMNDDAPWGFVKWLDAFDHADRRPVRNAILYFLFPDDLERNLSNEHRRQIVEALKHRLPEDARPKGRNPALADLDRAIFLLRKGFEEEFGTTQIDFYRPPIYAQWFIGIRESAQKEIGAALRKVLSEYDLELRQCGSKKRTLESCKPVDETTGFWETPADATNKPLRWFIHLDLDEHDRLLARVPDQHGARRIAFANTAQGTSGAVTTRIVPAIKVADEKFVFYETWEWMLLHCFLPALPIGSSGQLFDSFDETTGHLEYMGHEQPYIAAALITLNEDDDLFVAPELPRPLKYAEATEALRTLINVSPTAMEPPGTAEEKEKGEGDRERERERNGNANGA
ncbi:hypothetical protein [Roseospira navarrensis]|uniref:Uncharacterized protein n=1 Tax=Roseospira navarrensis TaxID=140058 RepID=A0A7X1ZFJ9_9PROT|nr:hypothetical protein [Roseospira navarrensis]MQX37619.1 hypothetical protein [Roseospira navarrensis]